MGTLRLPRRPCAFIMALRIEEEEEEAAPAGRPAKLCNVVPPMWHAATPVLAVAKVLFGGSEPMILFSRKDFPVPEQILKSTPGL